MPAAEVLVNLSQNSDLSAKMVKGGMVRGAMELLYKQGCCITKLLIMLLVNLTHTEAGIASLLQVIWFIIISVLFTEAFYLFLYHVSSTFCFRNLSL